MTESPVRETAQIIPFPSRTRGSKASLRDARRGVERLPIAVCDYGSGWYHDAAVQEDVLKHPTR
jgi:hypothetical protein